MSLDPLPSDDELFIRAACREGLLGDHEVAEGRGLQGQMRDMGLKPKPLAEVLLEKGAISSEEHARILAMVAKVKEAFRIPGFKLLKRLGRGSMGTVYKARQLNLDRVVAIKILARFLSENEAFVRRFRKEARVIGKLNHPNIVQGFDAGEAEGTYYFAMEYCDGPTVLQLLQRGGALAEDRATRIVSQVASALEHATHQGLVHRDVKPDNIMIVEGGVAKLCDLGLAKDVSGGSGSTEKGSTMGTPNYISPEQARGDSDVDIRSDIYSLGASFYHMVTGVPPYDGPNPAVIMVKHLNEGVIPPRDRNPDIKVATQKVILKMLAKNPLDRYQTPMDLLVDLQGLLGESPTLPPERPSSGPRVIRRRRR